MKNPRDLDFFPVSIWQLLFVRWYLVCFYIVTDYGGKAVSVRLSSQLMFCIQQDIIGQIDPDVRDGISVGMGGVQEQIDIEGEAPSLSMPICLQLRIYRGTQILIKFIGEYRFLQGPDWGEFSMAIKYHDTFKNMVLKYLLVQY